MPDLTITLDADGAAALSRYAGSAMLEGAGLTLTLTGGTLVPRIDGFSSGDPIPVTSSATDGTLDPL